MMRLVDCSCDVSRDQSGVAVLANKGGLQKVLTVFGSELDGLMDEMNGGVVA